MTLLRWQRPEVGYWSPFRHLSTLREEIDRLFESPLADFTRASQQMLSGWMPAADLYEDKDNLYVKAELPGMKKEAIEVSLHDGVLTLSGERKTEERSTKAEVYRAERFTGRFQRTFTLNTPVDEPKVKAAYTDGILTITLPKAEKAKPKQIEVSVK